MAKVICSKCGDARTTQPWKSTRKKVVNGCLKCSPGRLNKPTVTGSRPLTTVETALIRMNKK